MDKLDQGEMLQRGVTPATPIKVPQQQQQQTNSDTPAQPTAPITDERK